MMNSIYTMRLSSVTWIYFNYLKKKKKKKKKKILKVELCILSSIAILEVVPQVYTYMKNPPSRRIQLCEVNMTKQLDSAEVPSLSATGAVIYSMSPMLILKRR